MIDSLYIKDFILIDELKMSFDKGFNVITGETGAGKSIILRAIDVTFGAKSAKDMIKTGKTGAYIELTLKVKDGFAKELFEKQGIDIFDNELIISKEITQTASRSRVNGILANTALIQQLREMLIDLHSQHMTYAWLRPKNHITLLDFWGAEKTKNLLERYRALYKSYCSVTKALEETKNKTQTSEREVEFLKFQINEIENAQITDVDEEEKLENELSVLSNAERLKELIYSSYWGLYGEDADIVSALGKIKSNISKAAQLDSSLEEIEGEIVNCQEILKDVSSRLRDYADATELDEQKLNDVQSRIDLLAKIKRKYGNTLADVLESYERFVKELNSIEFCEDEILRLEKEQKIIFKELQECAGLLSAQRKDSGEKLSKMLCEELEKLDMPKVRFEIFVEPANLNADGADSVEFLISTNISETPKPLAKIASGGEISRVMLALKTVFAASDKVETIIFDEIDTGISGKASQAVAEEITLLSKSHQIISITHQPMIAAKASRHFYVSKSQEDVTKVNVHTLDENNRVKAVAMLAAGDITEDSLNFAKQLISNH